ncbi:MAG: hypothetical protein ACQESD_01160 [Thermoplasmatota archaeon]
MKKKLEKRSIDISSAKSTFKSISELEDSINFEVQKKYGRAAFISNKNLDGNGNGQIYLGCSLPKVIEDKHKKETVLKFIGLKDLDALEVNKKEGKYVVDWIEKEDLINSTEAEIRRLINKTERALLNTAKKNFVQASILRNGLNPIIEVTGALLKYNEISKNLLNQHESNYLDFLNNLNFIDIKDSKVIPGKEINKYYLNSKTKIDEQELLDTILSEILEKGYPFLKEKMRINHLTPFIRITNSNLFTSSIKGERLHFDVKDFIRTEKTLYGKGKTHSEIKTLNYLRELERVNVFDVEDGYYISNEEIWDNYNESISL